MPKPKLLTALPSLIETSPDDIIAAVHSIRNFTTIDHVPEVREGRSPINDGQSMGVRGSNSDQVRIVYRYACAFTAHCLRQVDAYIWLQWCERFFPMVPGRWVLFRNTHLSKNNIFTAVAGCV